MKFSFSLLPSKPAFIYAVLKLSLAVAVESMNIYLMCSFETVHLYSSMLLSAALVQIYWINIPALNRI